MLDKLRNMYKLQKQAKQIKKELKNIHIEAETSGVIVIINAEQNVIDIKIPPEMSENSEKLSSLLKESFNKALKKSQLVAAERMKDVMGDMGLPGMGG